MKVTIPGCSTITGKPEVILHLLRTTLDIRRGITQRAIPICDEEEGEKYIKYLCSFYKQRGIYMNITGESYSERSESLLKEMEKHNLIKIHEEELICQ